jgi:hypothetical protein
MPPKMNRTHPPANSFRRPSPLGRPGVLFTSTTSAPTNVLAALLHADAVVGEEFPASTTALPSMATSTAKLRSLALTPIYSEPVRTDR